MRSRALAVFVSLAAWPGGAQASTPAPAGPCAARDEPGQSRCAGALYAARKYAEAAAAFEALYVATTNAKYLYNAAEAREAAGSDGWALAHLMHYTRAPDAVIQERAEVEAQIAGLRGRLLPLSVEVTPPSALDSTGKLWFQRVTGAGIESFNYIPHDARTDRPGVYVVYLEPGLWKIRVEHATFGDVDADGTDHSVLAELTSTGAAVRVDLSPGGPAEPAVEAVLAEGPPDPTARDGAEDRHERRTRRMLSLGLGLTAGATVCVGIGLLFGGAKPPARGVIGDLYFVDSEVNTSLTLTAWGAGSIGAAGGLALSAGLEGLGPTRRRQVAQIGTGAGIVLVGLVVHAISFVRYDEKHKMKVECPEDSKLTCVDQTDADYVRTPMAISAGMLGAGVGMLAGALASYLVRLKRGAKADRPRLVPLGRGNTIGLAVAGRF